MCVSLQNAKLKKGHISHKINPNFCFQKLTRTVFLEENMFLISLNRPIIEKSCIYNLSFCVCVCVCVSMGAIFQNLSPSVTLKMGSRSRFLLEKTTF